MDGTGTRRAHAVEHRFVVDDGTAAEILSWARVELAPDPHGSGSHQDAYSVTTRYLDSPTFDTFLRRGSYGRAKYRMRRYGEDTAVFVERKLRTASVLAKRRSRVSLDALEQCPCPCDGVPAWFSRRVALRSLSPVCLIAYNRVARQLVFGDRVARLTIDSNICVTVAEHASFTVDGGIPLLSGQSIVELKYQDHPPVIFKALADRFIMSPRKISKYRGAVEALGLAPPARIPLMDTQL